MSSRKEQLRRAILKYLLQHGVAKLSLRPLAAKLGTSPRMLMFHFKSKEGLLQDVLGELHEWLLESFARVVSADSIQGDDAPLKLFWHWASSERNVPYLRLLYEVQIVALQNPAEYGRYLKKTSADWQTITLRFLSKSIQNKSMATLCIAVFDGLFLELLSTGDRARLTRALDEFISMARVASKQPEGKTVRAQRTQRHGRP
jgi:AcrR family transcriptional regulator